MDLEPTQDRAVLLCISYALVDEAARLVGGVMQTGREWHRGFRGLENGGVLKEITEDK